MKQGELISPNGQYTHSMTCLHQFAHWDWHELLPVISTNNINDIIIRFNRREPTPLPHRHFTQASSG